MYKAVTERKLIADDYFTAQFKVRHILKAAINSDKEKFREIFTTCSKTLKTKWYPTTMMIQKLVK